MEIQVFSTGPLQLPLFQPLSKLFQGVRSKRIHLFTHSFIKKILTEQPLSAKHWKSSKEENTQPLPTRGLPLSGAAVQRLLNKHTNYAGKVGGVMSPKNGICLLYTSDAADEERLV